jgi:hypothetical protein
MNNPKATSVGAPKLGQIWKDNDKRCQDRFLRIVSILDNGFVQVHRVAMVGTEWRVVAGAKSTKINAARFKPLANGYSLLIDGPAS